MAVITGSGQLEGTDGEDQITGSDGFDMLLGNGGNDTLEGAGGFDFAVYWSSGSAVGVQLFAGTVNDGFGGTDRLSNIEGVIGSAFDDIILGSGLSDVLLGIDGADTIQGLDGDDALSGNRGNDQITGGAGSDTVYFRGFRENYTVTSVQGGFSVTDNRGEDGTDVVTEVEFFRFEGDDDNDGNDIVFSAAEVLNPSANRPTADDDSLTGTARDDRIDALAGNDTVNGGAGDDTLIGNAGDDSIDGGAGFDTAAMGNIGFRGASAGAFGNGVAVVSAAGTDTLVNVETATFADGRLVFDADAAAAKVVRLYQAALGREADQGGLNAWTTALEGNRPLADLANGFLSSAEFNQRFGGLADNGAFIDRLYLNVLGREADADGKQAWLNAMNNGMGRGDALVGFSESAENKANTAGIVQDGIWDRSETATQVARLYDTVLGRRPDVEGLVNWKTALEGGVSLSAVADSFTKSAEFQLVYGNLDNTAFVQTLYRNTLEREAEQAGLDNWVNYLNSGAARSDAVLAFSESQEHVNLTANNIQSENREEFGILFA